MEKRGLLVRVYGRVQGVHLRGSAQAVARNLRLTGYARNNPDGSVELLAEGTDDDLKGFLEWVERGSSLARVERFEYRWKPYLGKYTDFAVVREGNILTDQIRAFRNLSKKLMLPVETQLPKHIVIIPDGNRRWAKERGLPTFEGHREGNKRFSELAKTAREAGIKTVTIWGFSTENWKRDAAEKDFLFKLFRQALATVSKDSEKNHVRFRHLGRRDRLPKDIVESISSIEKSTAKFDEYHLNLALDYGGRDELVRGMKKMVSSKLSSKDISEEAFTKFLDTMGMEDPDLIIRTSGEQRLSGILPWQGVYSELYFTPLHFPDFDGEQLKLAILDFSNRQRRFGK